MWTNAYWTAAYWTDAWWPISGHAQVQAAEKPKFGRRFRRLALYKPPEQAPSRDELPPKTRLPEFDVPVEELPVHVEAYSQASASCETRSEVGATAVFSAYLASELADESAATVGVSWPLSDVGAEMATESLDVDVSAAANTKHEFVIVSTETKAASSAFNISAADAVAAVAALRRTKTLSRKRTFGAVK